MEKGVGAEQAGVGGESVAPFSKQVLELVEGLDAAVGHSFVHQGP